MIVELARALRGVFSTIYDGVFAKIVNYLRREVLSRFDRVLNRSLLSLTRERAMLPIIQKPINWLVSICWGTLVVT